MHAVQGARKLGNRLIRHASRLAFSDRTLVLRVTNATGEVVRLGGEPYVAKGACKAAFTELLPGEAGTIRITSRTLSRHQGVSHYHHAVALELFVGKDRLVITETCPLGQSRRHTNRFSFAFSTDQKDTPLSTSLRQIPKGFMGSSKSASPDSAKGCDYSARATASSPNDVFLVILSDDVDVIESWDSLTQLRFAELCREHHQACLVPMLFTMDALAVVTALPQARLVDSAFALDLLVITFLQSGLLRFEAEGLMRNRARWEEARAKLPLAGLQGRLDFSAYDRVDMEEDSLEEYVEITLLLVRAAMYQSIGSVHRVAARFQEQGLWSDETDSSSDDDSSLYEYSPRVASPSAAMSPGSPDSRLERALSIQDTTLAEHLTRQSRPSRRARADDDSSSSGESSTESCAGHHASHCLFDWMGCCGKHHMNRTAAEGGVDRTDFLISLVHKCMQSAADYVSRRSVLYEFAATTLVQGSGGPALLEFSRVLPLAQRMLHTQGEDFPKVECKSFSMDALASLDEGRLVGPAALLESFGDESPRCKAMSTNSKSGEFFFISADSRFLVKTISDEESMLMRKMLPAMDEHIRRWPQSLIVRFAGLFHVEVPRLGVSQNFVVMRSVFDAGRAIHETYDLKGSLHNRKKKEGERIGKDEDWITSQGMMQLPEKIGREVLAMHELDAELLQHFEVMDYSLLVGIHRIEEAEWPLVTHNPGYWKPGCGILSDDCKTVYYVGLIDFLIGYDLRKEAEHLIRVVQGIGNSASCVSPEVYAKRQARFLRDRVVAGAPEGAGQLGRLRVEVSSARELQAADFGGSSDPYVEVTLGLLSARTPTVTRDLNPTWNFTLFLPVNACHLGRDLELSVWDEDMEAISGADDLLGKLLIPMSQVATAPVTLKDEPLLETTSGRLSAKVTLEPC